MKLETSDFDYNDFCESMRHYMIALGEAADHYEKSAPTVEKHLDDLYLRMTKDASKVSLFEIQQTAMLWNEGWERPNYAANRILHIRNRLGFDTSCEAGF